MNCFKVDLEKNPVEIGKALEIASKENCDEKLRKKTESLRNE